MERRGVRTVTICTDAFEALADLERHTLGVPSLVLGIVEHPLVSRELPELDAMADELMNALDHHFVS